MTINYQTGECDLAFLYKIQELKKKVVLLTLHSGSYLGLLFKVLGGRPPQKPRATWYDYGYRFTRGLNTQPASNLPIISNKEDSTLPTTVMATNVVEADNLVDTEQTTVFISDASVVKSSIMKPLKLKDSFRDTSDNFNAQDIKAFLGKPYKMASGVFSTTDTVSTFTGYYMPSDGLSLIHTNKLSGYFGFRAMMRFRIIFNATRFQQGRYMLCFVPYGGTRTTAKYADWYSAHVNTLVQRTQLPRVEFDLSCDTEATLEIPFNSAFNFYALSGMTDAQKIGTLGQLQIFPYVPLTVDTGLQTASWTLYVSYHDVELIGAAVPQSGRMGKTKKRNASEDEQKSKGIGPVESAMAIGHQISTALTVVPLLSNFAAPASWIFDALRGTAAHFGWSKPSNLSTHMRVLQSNAPYLGSCDNDDTSMPLSMSVKNQIDPALGFSTTDIDELDFKSFCTIPAYHTQMSWTTASAVGTSLTQQILRPSAFSTSRPLQLPGVIDYTPLAFTAEYFKYWRGSIVFKLKFVRTEFHSGRICVAFSPYEDSATVIPAPAFADLAYLNRHIIDIRECNEVTLTFPYIASSPWVDVQDQTGIGYVNIWVEDKLVAPSTVPQLCTILLEVAGGPDTEFAFPIPANITPGLRAVPQSGSMSREEPRNDCSITTACIGGTSLKEDDVVNAAFCIGEKISSFRTLLRHFNTLNTQAVTASSSYKNIVPFSFPTWTVDLVTPVAPFAVGDLYGALCSCFLYSRGGVRIKVLPLNDSDATQKVKMLIAYLSPRLQTGGDFTKILDSPGTTTAPNAANAFEYSSGPKVISRTTDGQALEIQVPQYARWHSRVNTDHSVSVAHPYDFAKGSLATEFVVDIQPLGVVAYNAYRALWFRAGSDDCNMGTFISIPPMVSQTGAVLN